MSSELLHYEDVKFRREGREILKGINWHVEEGENWALLGLNGAGKSTNAQHDSSLPNSYNRTITRIWS